MSPARAVGLAVMIAAAGTVACNRGTKVAPELLIKVPARAATAGDELLAMAPAGAGMVLELDVARLRKSAALGQLVSALVTASGPRRAGSDAGSGRDSGKDSDTDSDIPAGNKPDNVIDNAAGQNSGPRAIAGTGLELGILARADSLLVCAYDLGLPEAAILTLIRAADATELGTPIAPGIAALGPAELVARVHAVRAGLEPPLAGDRRLMAARTRAMPARADGAWLRMAATLDFEARVSLSGRLELDAVPVAVSIWGDVADDLAVIAELDAEDAVSAQVLARGLQRWRARLGGLGQLAPYGLGQVVKTIEISHKGVTARAVLLIGPAMLSTMVTRASRELGAHTEPSP